MAAIVTPIKHVITNCSRCDTWITDGQSTVTITVAKETWHGVRGEMAEVEVENAKSRCCSAATASICTTSHGLPLAEAERRKMR